MHYELLHLTTKPDIETCLGPFSTLNIRELLPVFQNKARDLSTYTERQIGSDGDGVIESECAVLS